jgi:hypothetical protein
MRGRKTGGRIAGTPNKRTPEFREFVQRLLGPPSGPYWKKVQAKLEAGELHPSLEGKLWAYAHGEPDSGRTASTGITVNLGFMTTTTPEAIALTIDSQPITRTTLDNIQNMPPATRVAISDGRTDDEPG